MTLGALTAFMSRSENFVEFDVPGSMLVYLVGKEPENI